MGFAIVMLVPEACQHICRIDDVETEVTSSAVPIDGPVKFHQ